MHKICFFGKKEDGRKGLYRPVKIVRIPPWIGSLPCPPLADSGGGDLDDHAGDLPGCSHPGLLPILRFEGGGLRMENIVIINLEEDEADGLIEALVGEDDQAILRQANGLEKAFTA